MLKNLLIYRLIVVNTVGLAILVAAYFQGLLQQAYTHDQYFILPAMAIAFSYGLVSVFRRAFAVIKLQNTNAFIPGEVNPTKFLVKGSHLDDLPEILTGMGLLGTILGFLKSVAGRISLDDQSMIMGGLQAAGWATAVSIFLFIWIVINKRILFTATVTTLERFQK